MDRATVHTPRVVIVTDPMCSWCFGMTPEFERLRAESGSRFAFDFLLAGINTTTTQPIGDYGRRRIRSLWREVTTVTGRRFGAELPASPFVYNSSRACVAVHAMRRHRGQPPFDFLHALQERFFQQGDDVAQSKSLVAVATSFGMPAAAMEAALDDPELHRAAREEFTSACAYGTHALPNVLIDAGDGLRLLAGGYVDAPTLRAQIEARIGSTR